MCWSVWTNIWSVNLSLDVNADKEVSTALRPASGLGLTKNCEYLHSFQSSTLFILTIKYIRWCSYSHWTWAAGLFNYWIIIIYYLVCRTSHDRKESWTNESFKNAKCVLINKIWSVQQLHILVSCSSTDSVRSDSLTIISFSAKKKNKFTKEQIQKFNIAALEMLEIE